VRTNGRSVKIAFIGVGNIGRPLAEHLRAAGHDVVVYDLRREAAASLVSAGAVWAESPGEAATGCALVATCLPGPVEMERVTLGPDGILGSIAPGAVYHALCNVLADVLHQSYFG